MRRPRLTPQPSFAAWLLPGLWLLANLGIPTLPPRAGAADESTASSFAFQKDDVVAIYGNGLADRMQHSPWVETVLQRQLPGLDVRFRNLATAGDTVS